jgi:hypothetical protein
MKSISQTFLDTLALRQGGIITRREVASLMRRWRKASITAEEAETEIDAVNAHGPWQVCPEATAAGLAWWRAQTLTPKGALRKTEFTASCLDMEPRYREAVMIFEHFELREFEIQEPRYGSAIVPIYRMVSRTGYGFAFAARSWQNGGNYII